MYTTLESFVLEMELMLAKKIRVDLWFVKWKMGSIIWLELSAVVNTFEMLFC